MRKKVIMDCDAGVDDALALILGFHSSELEIEAITAVNGNVPVNLVVQNIKKVLSLIRQRRKPVIAAGADRPLSGHAVYAHHVHGESGLGNANILLKDAESWWQEASSPAPQLIPSIARSYPDEITLIATAPLTNLALALRHDPQGMAKLKEVVVMGGAVRTKGNVTPFAEFNIFVDPLAAREVFESELPITLVPLDVTHQVFLTPRIIEEEIRILNDRFSQFLIDATGYDSGSSTFQDGAPLFYLHDPLAVGVAADRQLVRAERMSLRVETGEGDHSGQTVESKGGGRKIDVCLSVDSKNFLEVFLSRLCSPKHCRPD